MKKSNITYFDLETTGLDIKTCGIVSIYAINYKKKVTIDSKINPQVDISEEVTAIHGIKNKHVKGKPVFKDITDSLNMLFSDSDYICGYNICKYDMPLLVNLFEREGVKFKGIKKMKYIDLFYIVKNVFSQDTLDSLPRLNLESVYFHLTNKKLDAHNAKNDVIACVEILKIVDKLYPEWKNYVMSYEDLTGSMITNPDYVMKFGKHVGESIKSLVNNDLRYVEWMHKKGLINLTPEFINLILEK